MAGIGIMDLLDNGAVAFYQHEAPSTVSQQVNRKKFQAKVLFEPDRQSHHRCGLQPSWSFQ